MSLRLRLETESGVVVETVIDEKNTILSISNRLDLSNTCCIRFIDPFGDTVFNYLQSGVLIRELESLVTHAVNEEEHGLIKKVIALAKKVQDEPHRYIRIYGD